MKDGITRSDRQDDYRWPISGCRAMHGILGGLDRGDLWVMALSCASRKRCLMCRRYYGQIDYEQTEVAFPESTALLQWPGILTDQQEAQLRKLRERASSTEFLRVTTGEGEWIFMDAAVTGSIVLPKAIAGKVARVVLCDEAWKREWSRHPWHEGCWKPQAKESVAKLLGLSRDQELIEAVMERLKDHAYARFTGRLFSGTVPIEWRDEWFALVKQTVVEVTTERSEISAQKRLIAALAA